MADNTNNQSSATNINSPVIGVIDKIRPAESILVSLSRDPNVDELCAAIALTIMLDNIGKHATAIFSGQIPASIDFLQPGKTLESNTNSLQDFIISLNKEKADHLRYKVEGEFVRIYITPYRAQLTERDLEFSRGDYNVNLVIALDVTSADDLDAALAEHGRIMHDASSINITTGAPGKFGDIQWTDPGASSVSEMVNTLAASLKEGDTPLVDATIATALLTGIMSATDRFGNERTTPSTLTIASELMSIGADQRLISENIKTSAEPASGPTPEPTTPQPIQQAEVAPEDRNKLSVQHDDEPEAPVAESSTPEQSPETTVPTPEEAPKPAPTEPEQAPAPAEPKTPEEPVPGEKELEQVIQAPIAPTGSSLLEELRSSTNPQPVTADKDYSSLLEKELNDPLPTEEAPEEPVPSHQPPEVSGESPEEQEAAPGADNSYVVNKPKTVLQPISQPEPQPVSPASAESETQTPATEPAPTASADSPTPPAESTLPMPDNSIIPPPPPPFEPSDTAPATPPAEQLPPTTTGIPPIDPATPPTPEEPTNLGSQPAMQDQLYSPQANQPSVAQDPASFHLPGA